ncbi:hypothetical protein Ae201684P_007835 [Aphanomyces euteiches]|nr:hypothetical protein Ae201684P_007835 [Aphanomyces euteiches]
MLCGLSGAVCEVPVVNIKTGHIYEKRLIEEYIKTHGNVCPLSETPLTPEDLLPLKFSTVATGAAPPSKLTASIPSLLSALQTEYDAHALEMFELKQHLQTTRCPMRCINTTLHAVAAPSENGNVDPWIQVTAAVGARAKQLAHYRKKERQVEELVKEPTSLKVKTSQTLHKTDKPGILTVDIKGTVSGKIENTLTGHSKKVQKVLFHPTADVVFTASADKTIKLWTAPNYQLAHTLQGHDGAVTGLSVHPTGSYLGSSSEDATWAISDVSTGQLLKQVATNAQAAHSFQFHPDGAIFGTAQADKTIRIWDVATTNNVATFEGHTGAVSSIWFSENGYHLISGGADGIVKFWDLRKLKSVIDLDIGSAVHAVHLETGGNLLGVASDKVTLFRESGKKNWDVVQTFSDHTGQVTDVKLAPQLAYAVSTSLDRSMKVYA